MLEEKIEKLNETMSMYSSDLSRTKELIKEKATLEKKFNTLFKSIED